MDNTQLISTISSLVVVILQIVAYWKIFEKAGEPGWKALIPIYNVYLLFKLATGCGLMAFFLLIPIVDIFVYIVFCVKIGNVFGRGTAFKFGLIFFNTIFLLILGFGKYEYGGQPAKPNPFGIRKEEKSE